MCLHHQNRMTHSMFVFPTWKYGEAGTAKTPIYPIAQLGALKFAPTSTVSPSKTTAARDAEWTSTSSAAKAKRGREMQLAVVQIKAARAAHKCGLCARGEHDFSGCTKCRLSKNHGHWAQDCPEARKADWNERNGEQERRGRVTGIQQATKKGSKNLLTHTHTTRSHTLIQIPLCAMKTCLQTFMCECVSFE